MTYNVKIDVSPIYELISSFIVFTTQKWVNNLEVGQEWLDDVTTRLSLEDRQKFNEAAQYPFSDYDILYVMAIERGDIQQIDEFLEHLEKTDKSVVHHKIKSYISDVDYRNVERIIDNYVPLLRMWNEVYFKDVILQYQQLLEEDAEEKRILQHKMDPEALIEYATGGIVLAPGLPIEEVILLPSLHFRPINTYCFYANTLFLQYPIDLPEPNEEEPPIVLVRLTRALANPVRLRLLRFVADRPKSMHDLQQFLGEDEDMLMHHLMRLRVAGLLQVHLVDTDTEKYCIRPDGAAELHMFLESYIKL